MATTTNFGWETPDDTDLVKDGAAAIRTLGESIDTSMADLEGGTTGQVLSKTSNTDMDFTWVDNQVGSFTYITTVTFTSSSSIDLSNIFSSTYENYFIVGNYTCSNDDDLAFRYRVSGADNTTSNYNFQITDVTSGTLTGGKGNSLTLGRIAPTRASGSRISVSGYFIAPFLTQTKHSQMRSSVSTSTSISLNMLDCGFNAATSFTGITLFPGAGTITGTFSIFGIKNS